VADPNDGGEHIRLRFSNLLVRPMNEVTRILSALEQGDPHAAEQLLPLVYEELRQLAKQKLAQEKPGQTLQATALVHEAYLRLVGGGAEQSWENRGHFFAAAAEAMRRILVDNARRKRSRKRGGGRERRALEDIEVTFDSSGEDLLALDDALARLERENRQAADLAKLRVFTGLTVDEAADSLGVSRRSGFRLWTYARAFLQTDLADDSLSRPD
jgi:RNA polymerase sigma factor (TIGR02999 family)